MHRKIIENMVDGVALSRVKDGQIVYVNDSLCRLLGEKPEELLGKSFINLGASPEKTINDELIFLHKKALNGEHSLGEALYYKRDGSKIWCHLSAGIIDDTEGPLLVTFHHDITEQKEVHQALTASEILRQRAQKLVKIGHWHFDTSSNSIICTKELYEIFGLPEGAPFEEFDRIVHPEDREGAANIIKYTIQHGGVYDSTYRIVLPEKGIRWVHAIGEAVIDNEGNLIGIAGSTQDITNQKLAADELSRLTRLESLSVLAGGIAHDFNNIITMAMGNISLALTSDEESSSSQEYLANAEKAIQRGSNLAKKLMLFSKDGVTDKAEVELFNLIDELVELYQAGSSIKINLTRADKRYPVFADRGQLEQVFTNLIINAVQAMDKGGNLQIRMRRLMVTDSGPLALSPGEYVEVEVEDEGVGIPNDEISKVFEPYFSTKSKGTGLGLATSHAIVINHRGNISVKSTEGLGTVFSVLLPLHNDSDA